jgi:photosystem II stability/assembly factor-like uncharacterized protein
MKKLIKIILWSVYLVAASFVKLSAQSSLSDHSLFEIADIDQKANFLALLNDKYSISLKKKETSLDSASITLGYPTMPVEIKNQDINSNEALFQNYETLPLNADKKNYSKSYSWSKLETEPYPGKQDDIFFINEATGWYVNGYGSIYKTQDKGKTWTEIHESKGSFFRTIAFLDENNGFVGTVGTDYFPNVTDTIPLYQTADGGLTWTPVAYTGPYVKGLCAIDIVKESYINHGTLDTKYHLYAVGRVGSPANIMVSHDSGKTWTSQSMATDAQMLFDVIMQDKNNGIACAATSADIASANALILKTSDGGKTWSKVYQSDRPFETTWKASFPTPKVGYVTIQSYNPDPSVKQQRIAKTTDGGNTWQELDLVTDPRAREFGVGFIDELTGFVGTMSNGYATHDGGKTWLPIDLGRACNKIRIYKNDQAEVYGYAIGVDVFKLITSNNNTNQK